MIEPIDPDDERPDWLARSSRWGAPGMFAADLTDGKAARIAAVVTLIALAMFYGWMPVMRTVLTRLFG